MCFGRELKRQKREMEAAIEHFCWGERIAMKRRLDEIDAEEALKALEEAPTEEASAGEWQGEARGDYGGLNVNIILRNHVIVDNNHLRKKSRKKHYGKYHSMQAVACGCPNQAHTSLPIVWG
jgi:hypothetical protein